ncbi:MAG: YbbR-like domain-containing protein [bacterium]
MSFTIFDNYKPKLIIFFFAIFIWFFVITENDFEHVIEVPITPVNISESKVILNKFPKKAKVKIKGSGKDLIALSVSRGARLELDLSDVENSKTYQLEPENVFLSQRMGSIITEEIITPDSVTILLDDFKIKKIPIYPKIKPIPAPGYTSVGELQITPDSILISGPKSLVTKIDKIFTKEEEFSDLRFDFKKNIFLAPLPSDQVTAERSQVEIYLNIQKLLEVTLNEVPVEVRNAPKNMIVNVVPSTLSLVLEGGADLLTHVSRKDIIAYIDYARVRNLPGNEFLAVIERPPGVSYRDVKPKTFKLVFERRRSK